ncbi:MAG: hypothetical protein UW61_C0012G0004 [Candidatus Curtissbacteria bacterium GW2011_GWC1_44_33]|uniref:Uncharacterized protein n=1 Tax=Candidatus Curtissbacteria bacterium GW2011_GWC1_44_33 TaxID=1618413 RepID=A0A0G1M5U3_9BACT|nr:MAG: hypothetical protein UW61_C0012G0004 [Candidatus Curtissbacteria bacterium GW2011_GWC1_44_33]
MLQIHIGGTKRSGKTTIAKSLVVALERIGLRPVLLDVDEVRTEIFGGLTGMPDSEESLRFHRWTMSAIFEALIPRVVRSGGLPIVVAGHSRIEYYQDAVRLSEHLGTELRFLLVEAPTIEEAARRAGQMKADDRSDMRDFSNPDIQEAFLNAIRRIKADYALVADARLFRIPQGTPEEMFNLAFSATLKSPGQ